MVLGGLFGRRGPEPEPLPAVSPPEVPKNEARFVGRVLDEARSALDRGAAAAGAAAPPAAAGWRVSAAPVAGSGLTMARLEAEVPVAPDALFKLLRTMDGKRIIDPFPRERHSERVKPLRAPRGRSAEIVFSEAPRFHGLLRPREYLTCDAEAPRERLFVCKSALLDKGPLAGPAPGHVRANLFYAFRLREAEGRRGATRLEMVNWLDLGANTVPPLIANGVTERWYFQALMRRLNRYIDENGLAAGADGGGGGSGKGGKEARK
ncbi:hypothetical protein Rsub_11910 [Raphidocelis subcapitata]|uniref:START domain-containing protein n=1 Tax=Raphidocelis subcapitata TaxID=307507 RepID=A0A2V0PH02_9CHLO|nr:hypothetical protein Rsub_11910 [Raphidocelis subcapitata]|eukprot:GBF99101.1 hypothetical protein Rsub_11910 [Raphidocelis subcapitata]